MSEHFKFETDIKSGRRQSFLVKMTTITLRDSRKNLINSNFINVG